MAEIVYQCECCGEDFISRRVRTGEKLCAVCIGIRRSLNSLVNETGLPADEVLKRADEALKRAQRLLGEKPRFQVNLGDEPLLLLRGGKPALVVMSSEVYESLMATLEELEDEEAMQALKESQEDIKAGRLHTHEEVFGHPQTQTGQ